MAQYRPSNCKCHPKKRYVSSGICNNSDCVDVCTTPICGTPDMLTLLAPVVYDEIGINLCREVPLGTAVTGSQPLSASAQIVDVEFLNTNGDVATITPISGRPNCYLVTLQNLSVHFAITVYDCSGHVVNTISANAVYLPPASNTAEAPYMDEDTNPSSVELEIFAPYGMVYQNGTVTEPVINYIGFDTTNNVLKQGLDMIAIPKILNFDPATSSATIGITIYIKSVYFSQYLVPHKGRAVVPKGDLVPDENSICMDFVSGELLDYEIKPLELGPPKFEERLKNDCETCEPCCSTITQGNDAPSPEPVVPPENGE